MRSVLRDLVHERIARVAEGTVDVRCQAGKPSVVLDRHNHNVISSYGSEVHRRDAEMGGNESVGRMPKI